MTSGTRLKWDGALYAGYVAGAMPRDDYLGLINATGFVDIDVAETKSIDLPDELLSRYLSASELAAFRHSGLAVQSVTVRARKPHRT